jgi:hypothetical protein
MAPCAECGFDYESLGRGQVLAALASLADEHRLLLTSVPPERLTDHPRTASWSPLEYGCHVRDMLRFQRERIALAQAEKTPRFASMRRDERAAEEHYNDQDPLAVADEIVTAARELTGALAALDDHGWLRAGLYPWPVPEVRTVEWIGRRTTHELAHHLFDSRRLLGSARRAAPGMAGQQPGLAG